MAVAVVDTGVLLGTADTDDEHYKVAMEIVRQMDYGDLPTRQVTTLFSRLAEPAVLVPLAGQKRICMRTVLPSARG